MISVLNGYFARSAWGIGIAHPFHAGIVAWHPGRLFAGGIDIRNHGSQLARMMDDVKRDDVTLKTTIYAILEALH